MKKLMAAITLILLSFITPVNAGTVTLAWDPNPEPDIAGYRIYYREMGQSYDTNRIGSVVTNRTTATITNLSDGKTYFFVATAYNTSALESDYSNEVWTEMPPAYNITTLGATNIIANRATLRCEMTGVTNTCEVWFVYGVSSNSLIFTSVRTTEFPTNSTIKSSITISNLIASVYWYRAKVWMPYRNTEASGNILSFRRTPPSPTNLKITNVEKIER